MKGRSIFHTASVFTCLHSSCHLLLLARLVVNNIYKYILYITASYVKMLLGHANIPGISRRHHHQKDVSALLRSFDCIVISTIFFSPLFFF